MKKFKNHLKTLHWHLYYLVIVQLVLMPLCLGVIVPLTALKQFVIALLYEWHDWWDSFEYEYHRYRSIIHEANREVP